MARLAALDVFDDAVDRQRIVTFLETPPRQGPALPHELDGSVVLALHDGALFSVVDASGSPAILRWIEREYGTANTTRSWGSVHRIATTLAEDR